MKKSILCSFLVSIFLIGAPAYSLNDLVASFGRGQLTPEQRAKWAAMRKLSEEGEEATL